MAFTRQSPFSKKVTDLPDKPSPSYTASDIKTYIETPSDETKTFVDNHITELETNTGAGNIGAKKADGTTSDVQTTLDEKQTKAALSDVTGATKVGATKDDGTTSTVQGALDEKAKKGTDWSGTWQGFSPSQVDQTLNERVNEIAVNVKAKGALGDGVTDDTTSIQDAFNDAFANNKVVFFPKGTYMINSPIVFKAPFYGVSNSSSTLKALSTFSGNQMIDFNNSGERKFIRSISFDANGLAIQIFGSSGDAEGSSQSLFVDIWFKNTADNIFSVGGSSTTAVAGMLTGSLFLRCTWNGCAQWIETGQNQDDVTFISCRFHMDGSTPSGFVLLTTGNNVKFQDCYYYLANTNNTVGSIYPLMRVGSWVTRFENCFFESNGTNATHLFHLSDPSALCSFETIHSRVQSTTLIAFIRTQVNSATTDRMSITTNDFSFKDNTAYAMLDVFVDPNSAGKYMNFNFKGIDSLNTLVQFASGSGNLYDLSVRLDGNYKGKIYNGGISTFKGSSLLDNADYNGDYYFYTTASSVSPNTNIYTLPSSGIWLIHVVAKVGGSMDHMANGTFIVGYFNNVYDTLYTEQIGKSHFASGSGYGVNSLTSSNPTSSGDVTLSVGWTDGASHPVVFEVSAKKLINF